MAVRCRLALWDMGNSQAVVAPMANLSGNMRLGTALLASPGQRLLLPYAGPLLQMLSMELKGDGLYVSRGLSFRSAEGIPGGCAVHGWPAASWGRRAGL